MRNIIPILIMVACSLQVNAQTDKENIQQAKEALDVVHSCEVAFNHLNKVSKDGQQFPEYYLQMGKANDCKSNVSEALYYYNKFLESHPANDSVKKRVAELSDEKMHERDANESRISSNLNHNSSRKKKKKRICLDDNYYSFGIGYGVATGGDNAAYKNAFELNADYGFPVAKNHLLLEWAFNLDLMTNSNTSWFANAFQMPGSQITGLLGANDYNTNLGIMPVFVNKRHVALAAGPMLGLGFSILPETGEYTFTYNSIISLFYGVKADLFLGDYAVVYLQWSQYSANQAIAELNLTNNTVDWNQGMITIGARLKLRNWRFWGWY